MTNEGFCALRFKPNFKRTMQVIIRSLRGDSIETLFLVVCIYNLLGKIDQEVL